MEQCALYVQILLQARRRKPVPIPPRDIVEKGPLIFEKVDVNELNAIEDDIRAAVDNLARYVKNLSEDQARSSTDTVEY